MQSPDGRKMARPRRSGLIAARDLAKIEDKGDACNG